MLLRISKMYHFEIRTDLAKFWQRCKTVLKNTYATNQVFFIARAKGDEEAGFQ